LDLDARVEGLVHDLPRQDVLELRADERAALSGLDVLELHDAPQLAALESQHHAVLQVVRRRHSLVSCVRPPLRSCETAATRSSGEELRDRPVTRSAEMDGRHRSAEKT